MDVILLHTVSVIHGQNNVSKVVLKMHMVTYSYLPVHTFVQLHMVFIWLHTVNYTPPVSTYMRTVTDSFNMVFYGFYSVECPPLDLVFYTHSQVQKAIDGLTDPKYLEVLHVAVDAEDREAILKKVCMYECIYVNVCVYVEVLKWKYVNVIYF